jgi:putative membrane-bound dehydrogenase-like protein
MRRVSKSRRTIGMMLGLALLGAAGLAAGAEPKPTGDDRPFPTHEEILKTLRVDPGLRVELVAAEPEVESPVALAFDEDGRLWVVEMRDYPNGPPPGQPPEGRIKLLDDRDGDGRYETATVFADGLLFANGVFPWRGGLIVTAAPAILELRDTDGDGKADQRQPLLTGFAALNPQLRVSHPNLGPDGWIYVANGLRGGKVVRAGQENARPIDLGGMDFRFDLIHERFEAISGMGQFGLTFDDWGRRFVCDNRRHLRHVVLPSAALKRNPYLAVPDVLQDVFEQELGQGGAGAKLYPLSKNWTTSSLHTGRFTAACGVFIYRGDLLPEPYYGAAFTCDPTGNLVHEEILRPEGATFRSKPAREGVEFLASTDDRFRPVFLSHAPDGALYVVDMARAVIEHPEFMPVELKNRPDLLVGKDRGRIWRIVPENQIHRRRSPKLSGATTKELVALLEHENAWQRTTAQRLLIERGDPAASKPLRDLATGSKDPRTRLLAAGLLDFRGELDDELIRALLKDAHRGVRENAARLAGPRLAGSANLQQDLKILVNDPDPRVRFGTALALGEWEENKSVPFLGAIALRSADDRWTRLAIASALPNEAEQFLGMMTQLWKHRDPENDRPFATPQGLLALVREISALVGARQDAWKIARELHSLHEMHDAGAARFQRAALDGLLDGLARRGATLAETLKPYPDPSVVTKAESLLERLAGAATDPKQDLDDRLAAIRLLTALPWKTAGSVLRHLLIEDPDQAIRLAAVRALGTHRDSEVGALLVTRLKQDIPAVRREVLAALLRQPGRVSQLLDELEAKRLAPGDLDALATNQLLNHSRPALRERSRALLQARLPEERRLVLERYKAALDIEGEPDRGRTVFQKNCATCHRVAGLGVDVGPDIADTRVKTREALLTDILNPNGAIDGNYLNYVVSRKDGTVLNGLIVAESPTSITLRRAEGQTDLILRQDIEEIRSTGTSLMPEGLERTIPVEDMGHLLSFLKNWRYLDGATPGTR